VFNILN